MDPLLALWPAGVLALAGAALNAVFAYGIYATMAVGRPSLVALPCGALAALGVAGLSQAGLPLPLAVLAALLAGPALALGFGAATAHLPAGAHLLAGFALLLAINALAAATPGLPALLPAGALPAGALLGGALPAETPVVAVALLGLGLRGLHHSWHGAVARVLRHDARLAAGMGIAPGGPCRVALAVAGLAGALGGVCLALTTGAASGSSVSGGLLFAAIAAALLGGVDHWTGPALGALAVLLLDQIGQAMLPGFGACLVALAAALTLLFHPLGLTAPLPLAAMRWRARGPHPAQRRRAHRVDR